MVYEPNRTKISSRRPLGRKPRRQRKRCRTKDLISRTMAVHLRYNSWYISLLSSARQKGPYAYTTATASTTPSKKIFFYFTLNFLIHLDLSSVFVGIKICPCSICYECVQFQIDIRKISRSGSRSPNNAEFGHFTLLFCRGRKAMYKEL